MSVNIYLNTVPEELKGATRILKHEAGQGNYWDGVEELTAIAKIQPVLGTASVFRETLWHDGEELLGGEKYLLRTDMVYEREEPYDLDQMFENLDRESQANKAAEIAYELDAGSNGEADDMPEKAFELNPEN